MDQKRLTIPEPCHENWDAMSPKEQGRHCAVCDKVVTDFTGYAKDDIFTTIQAAKGTVCGRVNSAVLDAPELPVRTYMLFPFQQLRPFLLAFVAAFGWSVWGSLQAQTVNLLPDKVDVTQCSLEIDKSKTLTGRVLDTYSNEPLTMVRIIAFREGVAVATAYSDVDGNFSLDLKEPCDERKPFDLQISYLGRERTEFSIPGEIKNVVLTVDVSSWMPSVSIHDHHIRTTIGDIKPLGGIMVMGNTYTLRDNAINAKALYRPLDEWLFMNFSEINHSGRH